MTKLQIKVEELEKDGWNLLKYSESQMNNRFYKIAIMERDGKKIVINNRGGMGGCAVAC